MSAGTLERGAARKRAAVTSKRDRLVSRPWMAKVEDKLSRLGVPVGSILVASEREWGMS